MRIHFNKLPKIKGLNYKSTIDLNEDRDVIGLLGEKAVASVLEAEWGEYRTPDKKGDSFDFKAGKERVDVKSSTLYKGANPYQGRLLVRDGSKPMDRYIFCKVDLKSKDVYIVGTITYNDFQEICRPFEGKYPCQSIYIEELDSFEEYAEKIKETQANS